jgi:phosphoesterase RecJ-like protein
MYDKAISLIQSAQKIIVIQAENPDGDSLGSSLALEEIAGNLGKEVVLYCPVEIPKYMRYIPGWDRVVSEFDINADMAIIVDTTADVLLSKVLQTPGVRHFLETHPTLVIDHHTDATPSLSFPHTLLLEEGVSASQVIHRLATAATWPVNQRAAHAMLAALLSDTLGLTTQNVDAKAYHTASQLAALGASVSQIEEARREFMKKSAEILSYKGKLIERIEYFLEGELAIVRIPFSEIEAYSDQYNPSVLVLDEMRLVLGVKIAVALKTYPDGKLTGKIRSNLPIAADVAGYFGGGGHVFASGFRVYEQEEEVVKELIAATQKALETHESTPVSAGS